MPHYYFDLWQSHHWIDDPAGTELPDDAAAAAYGREVGRELARNNERAVRTCCITVRDAARQTLETIPLAALGERARRFDRKTWATLEASYNGRRDLQQAIHAARQALQLSRATLARSRRRPWLAVSNDP
jgi:hypothetical protein